MNQITVIGMVLSAAPVGEYDKRVVILTKERGKIAAFARGARKPHSPLTGAVSPFSFGEFTMYEGRSSYTLASASISNYFAELREDVEAAYYGFYFVDLAGYYAREASDETQLLKLLYQTFRALAKKVVPCPLIRYIYELKAIVVNGEGPQVFQCVSCGDKQAVDQGNVVFSALKGGVLCPSCAGGIIDGIRLNPSTLYALQYIVSSSIEKLYTFTVSEEVLRELKMLMERYMDVYVDKHFKSLEILEQITGVS